MIYAIIGKIIDGDGVMRWWPVAYRVDEADAKSLIAALVAEQDALRRKLDPIMAELALHHQDSPSRRSLGERLRLNQHPPDGQVWKERLNALHQRLAEIVAEHTRNGLDPLFPGGQPEHEVGRVKYEFVVFYDDPRELPPVEIIKKRAQLWVAIVDDYDYRGDDD